MRYVLVLLALTLTSAVARAQPAPALAPATGFDVTASIGLFSADRSETAGDTSWSGSFFKGEMKLDIGRSLNQVTWKPARRTAAQRVPIGATIKLRTAGGQRFKAVLFAVDDDGITVKPAARTPVASMKIPFDRVDSMERDEGRVHFGRYIGIGAAVGGAMLFILSSLGG